jgi:hypothetical protein
MKIQTKNPFLHRRASAFIGGFELSLGWYVRGLQRRRGWVRVCSWQSPVSSKGEATMIGYVTLGTNDIKRAASSTMSLATIGAKRWMETDSFIAWSTARRGGAIGDQTVRRQSRPQSATA